MLKHQLTSPIAQLHSPTPPQKLASRANHTGQMLDEQTNLEVKYIGDFLKEMSSCHIHSVRNPPFLRHFQILFDFT